MTKKRSGKTIPVSLSLREEDIERANYLVAMSDEIDTISGLVRWLITREYRRRTER